MRELFTEKDKYDINRLLEFGSHLIILDKEYGESLETISSRKNSYDYISAYFRSNNLTEEQNKVIIKLYKETNPYYKYLEDNFNIPPALSRSSKDLSILKATSQVLTKYEEELFYNCYYESLEYYNKITSTKAFVHHVNYKNFIKLFLVWSAIQKYISRRLDDLFNIDIYDAKTLKNFFISYGVDYFDNLPLKYQKRLLKKLNDIIANKGTNQCFLDILEVFNLDSLDINKYYLVKKNLPSGPVLTFYKTPYDQKLDPLKNEELSFEEVTNDDKYWKASKEEILEKEFNVIKTKYLSVDSTLNFNKDVLTLSYFFNLLEQLFKKNCDRNLYFYNKNISENKICLYDAFICINSLALKMNGYKDNIIKNPNVANSIYGYGNIDNSVEIEKLIEEINIELEKDKDISDNNKLLLKNFLSEFNISKSSDIKTNNISINDFLDIFNKNEKYRKTLYDYIVNTNNYQIYNKLNRIYELETKTTLYSNMFPGYNTYTEYLLDANIDLYNYCVVDESAYDSDEEVFNIYQSRIIDLTESMSIFISSDDVGDALSNSPLYGITNYLQYYIRTLILLFKSYTIELKDSYLKYSIKDEKDNTVKLRDYCLKNFTKVEGEYITPRDVIKINKN